MGKLGNYLRLAMEVQSWSEEREIGGVNMDSAGLWMKEWVCWAGLRGKKWACCAGLEGKNRTC